MSFVKPAKTKHTLDMWVMVAAMAIAALMIVAATEVQAQTFTVLHSFSGGSDGTEPEAGVTLDRGGNLYGTTSGWMHADFYDFTGGTDGRWPHTPLTIDTTGTSMGRRGLAAPMVSARSLRSRRISSYLWYVPQSRTGPCKESS